MTKSIACATEQETVRDVLTISTSAFSDWPIGQADGNVNPARWACSVSAQRSEHPPCLSWLVQKRWLVCDEKKIFLGGTVRGPTRQTINEGRGTYSEQVGRLRAAQSCKHDVLQQMIRRRAERAVARYKRYARCREGINIQFSREQIGWSADA